MADLDLSAAIRSSIAEGGDAPAIAYRGAWWSWRWIEGVGAALDRAVAEAGFAPDSPVGLVARNRPAHVAAFAAQLAARRTTSMIYSAQSPAGIAADVRRLRLPVLLADAEDWTDAVRAAAAEVGTVGIALSAAATPAEAVRPVPGLARHADDALYKPASTEIGIELLSSGTTGLPKRIPLKWRSIAQAIAEAKLAYAGSDQRSTPMLMAHPLGNIAGLAYIAPSVAARQQLVLLEKFEPLAWADAVRLYRPSRASLPPAGVQMLLNAGVPRAHLDSLLLIAVGGGKLDPAVQDRFEEAYGIPLLTAFGATEFGGVVANWTLDSYRRFGREKRGSAGQASANVRLRVVDPETFEALPAGETGLLEAHVPRIADDWIRTTDLASIDADGFLFLHGRADSAINRGGFKIVPEIVAGVLKAHPAVMDAAVVGLPDARLGAVPVAAVELHPGAEPVDGEALRAWLKERLVAYQVPTEVKLVDALPRNASMKISAPDVLALFGCKAP